MRRARRVAQAWSRPDYRRSCRLNPLCRNGSAAGTSRAAFNTITSRTTACSVHRLSRALPLRSRPPRKTSSSTTVELASVSDLPVAEADVPFVLGTGQRLRGGTAVWTCKALDRRAVRRRSLSTHHHRALHLYI